jgi:hypothetical protein
MVFKKCCEDYKQPKPPKGGAWVCCNGKAIPCDFKKKGTKPGYPIYAPEVTPGSGATQDEVVSNCIKNHELAHEDDIDKDYCKGKGNSIEVKWDWNKFPPIPGKEHENTPAMQSREEELYCIEIKCLQTGKENLCPTTMSNTPNVNCLDIYARISELTGLLTAPCPP